MRTDSLHTPPASASYPTNAPRFGSGPPIPAKNARADRHRRWRGRVRSAADAVVFVPFVLGLLLFYALDPLVDRLQRMWVPRAAGAALALTLAIGGVGFRLVSASGPGADGGQPAADRRTKDCDAFERHRTDPPGPMDKVQQAAEELQNGSSTRPPPGVMRVQVEQPSTA